MSYNQQYSYTNLASEYPVMCTYVATGARRLWLLAVQALNTGDRAYMYEYYSC